MKKNKIYYVIVFALIIVCSITYYFIYYKDSSTYVVNTFFGNFKNGTQGQRNTDEIYDMAYFKVHSSVLDNTTKFGYQSWTIKNFHILHKQKLDDNIYQFHINMDENHNGGEFFRNTTFDCWTIKQNDKWFIVLGVHNVSDDILDIIQS